MGVNQKRAGEPTNTELAITLVKKTMQPRLGCAASPELLDCSIYFARRQTQPRCCSWGKVIGH